MTTNQLQVTDQPELRTALANIGKAVANKSFDMLLNATMEYNGYVSQIEETNATLTTNNKIPAAENLKWTDRKLFVRCIRRLASKLHRPFGIMHNELYTELLYKHGIGLVSRQKRNGGSCIQHIKEKEWGKVLQTFASICEAHGLSTSELMTSPALQGDTP